MARKLLLIDAFSSIYRAFFALPALSNSHGVPTHATLGFVNMLQKLLREQCPDYLVVVWDAGEPERRMALYPEYKAKRDAMPEDLSAQLPYIRRAVEGFGLKSLEYAGEEADDVIGTLVQRAVPKGLEVEIVSTDRDLLQLVSPQVTLLDTMRDRRFGPDEVLARFGVPPERMLDYRALVGDTSDNIPGVRGIGEKGAAKLIQEYASLDELFARASEISAKRTREALLAGADSARLSRELSRLATDLPLEIDLESCGIPEPDRAALAELFGELELRRLRASFADEADAPPPTTSVKSQLVREESELRELAHELAPRSCLALATLSTSEDAMRGELFGLALAAGPEQAYLVPVAPLGLEVLVEVLGPLLEAADRSWLGFDLKRDWEVLSRLGITLRGELRDLAVAAYVVEPTPQVRRVEVLMRTHLSRELRSVDDFLGKGARRRPLTDVPAEDLADFFGTQVGLAFELERQLLAKLEASGQLDLYRSIEIPLVSVLARMERAGVRVDEEKLGRISREIEDELARLERSIYELAGEEFKINSPKQLQRILFEKLALPPSKKTKTGFSTDESVLEELSLDHVLPGEILQYRKLSKLKSTYVDALPRLVHPETGRIHCSFNQTVAATGRLSASNPNLQNIPIRTPLGLRIREAFIPREGALLLAADYSQIELRILAHLSQDEPLLEAFRRGEDIHVRTASQVFEIPPEEVSDEQRSQMKGINFGIIYGSSAFGIARQLGISQADAQSHIQAYFERYPGVRRFLDRAIEEAREKGYAETLDGRRRYLPDLHSRNRVQRSAAERMATNSVLQGTAADIIKRAMVEIDAALEAPGAPEATMILTVHDELVFETPPDRREALQSLVEARMEGVAKLSVPLRVNVNWGLSWREAH